MSSYHIDHWPESLNGPFEGPFMNPDFQRPFWEHVFYCDVCWEDFPDELLDGLEKDFFRSEIEEYLKGVHFNPEKLAEDIIRQAKEDLMVKIDPKVLEESQSRNLSLLAGMMICYSCCVEYTQIRKKLLKEEHPVLVAWHKKYG